MTDRLIARAGTTLVTGVVGVAAVDLAKRLTRAGMLRRGAVAATALGLRGARAAETGAEAVRLSVGDIVAEARGRIGEQAPPPSGTNGSNGPAHEH